LHASETPNHYSETSPYARTAEQSDLHTSLVESSQHVLSPWDVVSEPSGSEHWTPAVSPVGYFPLVSSSSMLRIYHSALCLLSTLPRRLDRRLNLTSTSSHLLTPAWLIQGVGEELPPPKLSLTSPQSRGFIPPSLCQAISPKSEVSPVYPSRAQRRFKPSTSATTLH
jgi:hypothetical protein